MLQSRVAPSLQSEPQTPRSLMLTDPSAPYPAQEYSLINNPARLYQLYQQFLNADILSSMRVKQSLNHEDDLRPELQPTRVGQTLNVAPLAQTNPLGYPPPINQPMPYSNTAMYDTSLSNSTTNPLTFTNQAPSYEPQTAKLIAALAEHMLILARTTHATGFAPNSPVRHGPINHGIPLTTDISMAPVSEPSAESISPGSDHVMRSDGPQATKQPPHWTDLQATQTPDNGIYLSLDTTGSPQTTQSPFDSSGCIDLSMTSRRMLVQPDSNSIIKPTHASLLSKTTSPDEKQVGRGLMTLNRMSTPIQRSSGSLFPLRSVKLESREIGHALCADSMDPGLGGASPDMKPVELTPSHSATREHAAYSPSSNPATIARSKHRKSGFQAGVTVGYTYDAFFVSDGRSRRRGKGKHQQQQQQQHQSHHHRQSHEHQRRSRNESGLLSLSSSSSSGNSVSSALSSSGAEPSTELATATGSCCVPQPTPNGSQLLIAASLSPPPDQHTQRYSCPDCGKTYATSSNLSRHKQTHRSLDSQAARKCPQCGKTYVSMPALSMHILTHDLKHRCDLCGKAFSRPWLLQGHRRAHTGEKPYGCAHCGRAFADRSNLRAHMQTHSGMKQYECKRCHKNFALKSYLNKHLESACLDKSSDASNPARSPIGSHGVGSTCSEWGPARTPRPQQQQPETRPSSTVSWSVTQLIDN